LVAGRSDVLVNLLVILVMDPVEAVAQRSIRGRRDLVEVEEVICPALT
jgi:hypothetical protein